MYALAPVLPVFGNKMLLVAITPMGRLYFDRWRAFEGRAAYVLTGFENTEHMTREGAARVLRLTNTHAEPWTVKRNSAAVVKLALPARRAN